jgi:hypothetical protein
MGEAYLEPDGTCWLYGYFEEARVAEWPSLAAWAAAWLDEWSSDRVDHATDFANAMTLLPEQPSEWAVEALVLLSEMATPDQRGYVGAGPLEDLLSHSGNGAMVLDEVEHVARTRPAFRTALSNVWLGENVPEEVRHRLAELGARDFVAEHAMTPEEREAYFAERKALGLDRGYD